MIDLDTDVDYVIEMDGEVVASGGFLLHYDKPFADLYMPVRKEWRRLGIGSFLLQEGKKGNATWPAEFQPPAAIWRIQLLVPIRAG